jgi:zinc transport system substrate-binding protein
MVVILGLLPLAACRSDHDANAAHPKAAVHVVASFYPLQFIVERIGADRVEVDNLTPAGTEPHEVELTAKATAELEDADLVVFLSGFAPSVDEGVRSVAKDHAFDVAPSAQLDGGAPVDEGSGRDPHFWLDPTRLAAVATALTPRLAELDAADAATFRANGEALVAELHALDQELARGLAKCASSVIVTSHNAFGYLATRYGLTQVGITGLTPEDEPTPGNLAAVSDLVRREHVTTIYYETLVDPTIARTIASETGAHTAVLDPIEGVSSDAPPGTDYFTIMRANLATLRAGQNCAEAAHGS